jgi:hypothetical protein
MTTDAELNDMMGTIRRAVTFTFASGVTGALVDLGKGRSLVSFEIPVALADGSMTFKKGAGGDEQDDAPTTTFVIQNENGTGADTTAYTVDHSTGTTSHPVNAPGFRGARWLAAISSAGQGTKTLTFITEPT